MIWVWILLGLLVVIIIGGIGLKLFLKHRLNNIDGCNGIDVQNGDDDNVIGKL